MELLNDDCCMMCKHGVHIEEEEFYEQTPVVYCKMYGFIHPIDHICGDYE